MTTEPTSVAEGEGESHEEPTTTPPTDKMVPERNIIALKKRHKEEMSKEKARSDELYTKNLDLEASNEKLVEASERNKEGNTKLKETEDRLALSELHRGSILVESVDKRKENMSKLYGIEPKTLEEKTPEQLDALDEALSLVGKPKETSYAVTVPAGASPAQQSAMEQAGAEIEAARKRAGQQT